MTDNFEDRLRAVEERLHLSPDPRGTRDLSDLKQAQHQTNSLVQAIAFTQSHQLSILVRHSTELADLKNRQEQHGTILNAHTESLARQDRTREVTDGKLDHIIGLLERASRTG